ARGDGAVALAVHAVAGRAEGVPELIGLGLGLGADGGGLRALERGLLGLAGRLGLRLFGGLSGRLLPLGGGDGGGRGRRRRLGGGTGIGGSRLGSTLAAPQGRRDQRGDQGDSDLHAPPPSGARMPTPPPPRQGLLGSFSILMRCIAP